MEAHNALMLQERFQDKFGEPSYRTPEQIATYELLKVARKTASNAVKQTKKAKLEARKAKLETSAEHKAAVQARLLKEWEKDIVIAAHRQIEIDKMPKYKGNKNA